MILSPPSLSGIKRFLDSVAGSEGEHPLVIVPGAALRVEVESYLMSGAAGFGGVEVTTLAGFASSISGVANSPEQLFSALLHSLLSAYGAELSDATGANVNSFRRLFDIFRQAGISGEEAGGFLKENCTESPLVDRIGDLYRRYCDELTAQFLIDDAVIFDAASEALDLLPLKFTRLFILGFYSLTPCQMSFLNKLSGLTGNGCERFVEMPPEAFKVELPQDLLRAALRLPSVITTTASELRFLSINPRRC